MSIHLVYFAALCIIVVFGVLSMNLLYRKSIVAVTGSTMIVFALLSSVLTYIFASFGWRHAFWIVPTEVALMVAALGFINRTVARATTAVVLMAEKLVDVNQNCALPGTSDGGLCKACDGSLPIESRAGHGALTATFSRCQAAWQTCPR